MDKGVVQITVTRWVPLALVAVRSLRAGEQGLLVDAWVSGLIEGDNSQLLVGVLLDNSESVIMRIE